MRKRSGLCIMIGSLTSSRNFWGNLAWDYSGISRRSSLHPRVLERISRWFDAYDITLGGIFHFRSVPPLLIMGFMAYGCDGNLGVE